MLVVVMLQPSLCRTNSTTKARARCCADSGRARLDSRAPWTTTPSSFGIPPNLAGRWSASSLTVDKPEGCCSCIRLTSTRPGSSGLSSFRYVDSALCKCVDHFADACRGHQQQKQDELFWDAAGGGYFYTPQSPSMPLIVRTKDFMDGCVRMVPSRRVCCLTTDSP